MDSRSQRGVADRDTSVRRTRSINTINTHARTWRGHTAEPSHNTHDTRDRVTASHTQTACGDGPRASIVSNFAEGTSPAFKRTPVVHHRVPVSPSDPSSSDKFLYVVAPYHNPPRLGTRVAKAGLPTPCCYRQARRSPASPWPPAIAKSNMHPVNHKVLEPAAQSLLPIWRVPFTRRPRHTRSWERGKHRCSPCR